MHCLIAAAGEVSNFNAIGRLNPPATDGIIDDTRPETLRQRKTQIQTNCVTQLTIKLRAKNIK